MNETKTEWRDCADPDELAAAVAAGVVPEWAKPWWPSGEWALSTASSPANFAGAMRRGNRYKLPASWTWRPEPPAPDEVVAPDDDLRERIARVGQDTDPELVRQPEPPADDLRERTLAQVATGSAAWSAVRRHLTQFEPITSAADMDALASEIADAVLAVLPTPLPVPPWPGAVLSGLCDEDGEPTWLAQAPNVQGEAVRTCVDFPWFICGSDNAVTPYWVEVRAPRAVPESETERVPWWKAKDRNGLAGDPFVEVGSDDEGPWVRVVEGGTKLHSPVAPDGTVEVLKDGGQ